MNKNNFFAGLLGSLLACSAAPVLAQASGLRVTTGIDYTSGDYGTGRSGWTLTVPVMVKYETGPVTLRVTVPYVRTKGCNRDVGFCSAQGDVTQSGLGDTVVSGFYNLLDPRAAAIGVDVGLKLKLVTADRSKDLITTGNNDYSLQADAYKTYERVTLFGTIGWTLKGDIRARDSVNADRFETFDPKDPWYASAGGTYRLTDATRVGLAYDWRERLFSGSKPISEATVFVSHKLTRNWRLQGYGLTGFSRTSPDWGLGANVGYGF